MLCIWPFSLLLVADKFSIMQLSFFISIACVFLRFSTIFDLSAHNCIKSEHPLLRVIGVLHRKLGKSKVNEMLKAPHPMVVYFADFRIKAEAADLSQKI